MKPSSNIFLLAFLLIMTKVSGQDAELSQFYNAPTMFNAAEIGHRTSGGKFRINGVHRNLGEGFKTTNLAFDNTLDFQDRSYLGVGGAFIHDENKSGSFQTMTFLAGFSMHLSLGQKEKHFLSLGSQFGVVNSQLRTEKLIFESDILGSGSEDFISNNFFNMDSRAGVMYSFFPSDYAYVKIGLSANHFVAYENRFISDISPINTQYSISIDYSQKLYGDRWIINPHLLYLSQGTFEQALAGIIATYNLNNGMGFSLGGSYKTTDLTTFDSMNSRDAVIGILGVSLETGSRVYVSHSFNISPLNNLNNATGNLELGIQWIINSANNSRIVTPDMLRNQGN